MEYKEIAPLVAIDAMGAPMPRIIGAIGQAAQEFFRRTTAYKLSLPPQWLELSQRRVSLQLPRQTMLVGVTQVKYAGREIEPAVNLPVGWEKLAGTPLTYLVSSSGTDGQDYVEETYIEDDYFLAEGPIEDTFDSIRVIPFLAKEEPDQNVQVEYAVTPTLSATSVPDGVGYRYQHALVVGAKAYILADADKPWSKPAEASIARSQFEDEIRQGMRDARLAGSPGTNLRVRMRRF